MRTKEEILGPLTGPQKQDIKEFNARVFFKILEVLIDIRDNMKSNKFPF